MNDLRPIRDDVRRLGRVPEVDSQVLEARRVWREAVGLAGPRREEFLTTVALPRLERLIEVAEHRARPWIEATRPSVL